MSSQGDMGATSMEQPQGRQMVKTQHLARMNIGTPGHRPAGLGGYQFARAIHSMWRYLLLRRMWPEFNATIELTELRVPVPTVGLHVTTFITAQANARDAWYLRVARPIAGKEFAEWPTLLLDYDPHEGFPLSLEVMEPLVFSDGDWLDNLWLWCRYQVQMLEQSEEGEIAQRVQEIIAQQLPLQPLTPAPATLVVPVPASMETMVPGEQQQNPVALHRQIQELTRELEATLLATSYADLHPMEAAVSMLVMEADTATSQRKTIQEHLVALHARAVPAFAAAMQGLITSDDEQWLRTRDWLTDKRGVPQALQSEEITVQMATAASHARTSFRDDFAQVALEERIARRFAYQMCGMAPGGHIFLAKDPVPRHCTRCGVLWSDGQPLQQENRPRIRTMPVAAPPLPGPRLSAPDSTWLNR